MREGKERERERERLIAVEPYYLICSGQVNLSGKMTKKRKRKKHGTGG